MTDEKAKLDEKGYLIPREHLIKNMVPEKILNEYYDTLVIGGMVYTCVILRDGVPKLFFEAENKESDAVCRVFWRKDDIERYIKYVKMIRESNDGSVANLWEISIDNLVKSLRKSCDKIEENRTYKALASTYISGSLEDVDLFWTANTEIML